jgi:hypothetical protein
VREALAQLVEMIYMLTAARMEVGETLTHVHVAHSKDKTGAVLVG